MVCLDLSIRVEYGSKCTTDEDDLELLALYDISWDSMFLDLLSGRYRSAGTQPERWLRALSDSVGRHTTEL